MAATNQILPPDPAQEIAKARALAERYYHESATIRAYVPRHWRVVI